MRARSPYDWPERAGKIEGRQGEKATGRRGAKPIDHRQIPPAPPRQRSLEMLYNLPSCSLLTCVLLCGLFDPDFSVQYRTFLPK